MAVQLMVALVAGMLSVLTPCVLPLLPALLAVSASGQGRRRAWGTVLGVAGTFGLSILVLGLAIQQLGLPGDALRRGGAVMLGVIGLVLLVPALRHRLEMLTSRLSALAPAAGRGGPGGRDQQEDGFLGG